MTSKSKIQKTYIIHDTSNDIYKIGKTNDIEIRLRNLSTGNINLKVKYLCDVDIEDLLQRAFAKKHIRLEWFKLNKNDLDFINNTIKIINKSIAMM